MKTIKIETGEVIKNDNGVIAKKLFDEPEAVIIHIQVQAGGRIDPHPTPVDMEFFVLEGRGIFFLGDQSVVADAGTLIPSPRTIPHGMQNLGPGVLRVLAIKNPRP